MSAFSVKVAIVPSKPGPLDPSEEVQIQNLTALFTHNNLLSANMIPNMTSITVFPLLVDEDCSKQGDTYDHMTLMKLLGEVNDDSTFVVYVKSTTVCTIEANALVKLIYDLCSEYMSSQPGDECRYDIMYLCKWADRCDFYTPLSDVFNPTVKLVKTSSPQGLQSVLISPSGACKIKEKLGKPCSYPVSFALTQMVNSGNLSALTTTPNVMFFGTQFATHSSDYIKTHECSVPSVDGERPKPKSSNLSLFIFVVIFIIVIIVFYFLITMVVAPTPPSVTAFPAGTGAVMQPMAPVVEYAPQPMAQGYSQPMVQPCGQGQACGQSYVTAPTTGVLSTAGGIVGGAANTVTGIGGALVKGVGSVGGGLVKGTGAVIGGTVKGVGALGGGVVNSVSSLAGGNIGKSVGALGGGVVNSVGAVGGGIVGGVRNVGSGVGNAVSGTVGSVPIVGQGLSQGFNQGLGVASNLGQGLSQSVSQGFNQNLGTASNLGQNMSSGLNQGMQGTFSNLNQSVMPMASQASMMPYAMAS